VLIEQWFEVFDQLPLVDWIDVPYIVFDQLLHSLLLLFKLTILEEPSWDTEDVKKRANLLDIQDDNIAPNFGKLPQALGLVDAVGAGHFGKFSRHLLTCLAVSDDFAMYFADDP
jgi:hypothetical protein